VESLRNHDSHRNVSELLDNLLRGYDNSIRPDFGGAPTIVEINIMVRSMGPISEVDMTYSMDMYFRQSWIDKRLAYSVVWNKATLALSISMLERIWKPDTYFYNGKQSYLHTITTPNKFVRLYQDGRVLYSSRLTVKASCPMHLEDFPMDTQRCPLKLGSFGYTTRDVLYRWKGDETKPVDIAADMKMSQFDLISTPSGNATDTLKSGERSVLEAVFCLRRHTGYFLLQVYFPCILLVVVSWVAFWINREATADRVTLGKPTSPILPVRPGHAESIFHLVSFFSACLKKTLEKFPNFAINLARFRAGQYSCLLVDFHLQRHMGNFLIQVYGPCTLSWVSFWLNREATADRVSLGVMTVLTMTFLGLEARNDLPKVPYPTALDFFVFLSFVFIFATIIQFAVVHYFTKNGSGELYFNESSSSEDEEDERESGDELNQDERIVVPRSLAGDCALSAGSGGPMSVIEIPPPPPIPSVPKVKNGGMSGEESPSVIPGCPQTHAQPRCPRHQMMRDAAWKLCGKNARQKRRLAMRQRQQLELENVNSVSKVDKFARIFFPVSFLFINVVYWYSYLYKNDTAL
ncbi:Gamma-aminobutyric acid receptor alpha-like, partial [Orchesella cincta]